MDEDGNDHRRRNHDDQQHAPPARGHLLVRPHLALRRLAFERLPQVLMGLSVHVRYRPLFLGGLLKARGQRGPAEISGKREWTFRHVQWLARQQGTVLDLPAAHPFNPLPLLRLGLAAASPSMPGDTSRYVAGLLFRHVWEGGGDAADPQRLQALEQVLRGHVAERGGRWPGADDERVRAQLRANTDEALAAGVFGTPAMVDGEGRVFWGLDALPMLRDALGGGAWFAGEGWAAASRLPNGLARTD
jgi:2-hydroxychromene-2-carboxylate isomerase